MTPGDHLQTAYNLWLPGHQLARGEAPWLDPYSFQPEIEPRVNFAGWPFAAVYGPLQALLGTVAGWNVFVLLTYVGAGGLRGALAAGARAAARRGARRRARVLPRAVPGGSVDRSPARADLDAAPTRALRRRAPTGLARGRRARVDPALRPGAPRAGCDPVRRRLRTRAPAAAARRLSPEAPASSPGCSSGRSHCVTPPSGRTRKSSATPPPSATSSPATRASSSASSTSAGSCPWPRSRAWGACVSETQSPRPAASPSCSGSARSCRACSRSARTCPATACSGGIRPSTRRAYPSACSRSPASASPPSQPSRWLVFQKHKVALGSSPRSRPWSSRRISGCRCTTRSLPTKTTPSTSRSQPRRRGGCSRARVLPPDDLRGLGLRLLLDAGAAGAAARLLDERSRRRGVRHGPAAPVGRPIEPSA